MNHQKPFRFTGGQAKDEISLRGQDLIALGYDPEFRPLQCGNYGCSILAQKNGRTVVVKLTVVNPFLPNTIIGPRSSNEYENGLFAAKYSLGPGMRLHPMVLQKKYRLISGVEVYLVEMDFAGSALDKLKMPPNRQDLVDLASACYALGFVHGDLSSAVKGQRVTGNIVYNEAAQRYRLIDFGLSILPPKKGQPSPKLRESSLQEWTALWDNDLKYFDGIVFGLGAARIPRQVLINRMLAGYDWSKRAPGGAELWSNTVKAALAGQPIPIAGGPKFAQPQFAPLKKDITPGLVQFTATPTEHDDDEAARLIQAQKQLAAQVKPKVLGLPIVAADAPKDPQANAELAKIIAAQEEMAAAAAAAYKKLLDEKDREKELREQLEKEKAATSSIETLLQKHRQRQEELKKQARDEEELLKKNQEARLAMIRRLVEENAEAKFNLVDKQREADALRERVDAAQQEVARLEANIRQREEELAAKQAELEAKGGDAAVANVEEKIRILDAQRKYTDQALRTHDEDLALARAALVQARLDRDTVVAELDATRAETEELVARKTAQVEAANARLTEVRGQVDRVSEMIREQEDELDDEIDLLDDLKIRRARIQGATAEEQAEIAAADAALKEHEARRIELSGLVADNQKDLAAASALLVQLENALEERLKRAEAAQAILDEARQREIEATRIAEETLRRAYELRRDQAARSEELRKAQELSRATEEMLTAENKSIETKLAKQEIALKRAVDQSQQALRLRDAAIARDRQEANERAAQEVERLEQTREKAAAAAKMADILDTAAMTKLQGAENAIAQAQAATNRTEVVFDNAPEPLSFAALALAPAPAIAAVSVPL
jgi:hypothetical protein